MSSRKRNGGRLRRFNQQYKIYDQIILKEEIKGFDCWNWASTSCCGQLLVVPNKSNSHTYSFCPDCGARFDPENPFYTSKEKPVDQPTNYYTYELRIDYTRRAKNLIIRFIDKLFNVYQDEFTTNTYISKTAVNKQMKILKLLGYKYSVSVHYNYEPV